MPLAPQSHQGQHGEAFVFSMASAAGLLANKPFPDVDGVDWTIGYAGILGTVRSPKIDVQVKSSSSPRGDAEHWHYRLRRKHFDALAGPGFALRRYLLLVTVPSEASEYAVCDADRMELRRAAYWVSLAAERTPASTPGPAVLVRVPRCNLLNPSRLLALVAGDEAGAAA
ncbi:DUF4365 domain-containing protein [Mangrovihabitans endophyticus]|uniref:DUF4365 domain-containing protein n=1 Tax=Mangrovihabitans endophyticus TaxID=1751298 RepID=A0A8J3C3X7_9ACTN|nr:DUF4365 domain-containing protein [Mangrovihabitans endophyticus]GGL15213.1 hypothetical protein GCM10012284_57320 [Mangrovihabitans endophyticus]